MKRIKGEDYLDLECTRDGECVMCNQTVMHGKKYYTDSIRITDSYEEGEVAFAGDGWMEVDICDECFAKLDLEDEDELAEYEQLLEVLTRLLNKGLIKVEVNIIPAYSNSSFNVTKTTLVIGEQRFTFEGKVYQS